MDAAVGNQNKVKYMATQLLAKFEENAPAQSTGVRRQGSIKKEFPQNLGGSDTCYFCQKRVYVMERLSAEGKFFHRSCFKCEYCATTLRLSAYAYDIEDEFSPNFWTSASYHVPVALPATVMPMCLLYHPSQVLVCLEGGPAFMSPVLFNDTNS